MKDSFSVIALVSLMFYQNWKLALFAILMMPICCWFAKSLGKRIGKAVGQAGEISGRLIVSLKFLVPKMTEFIKRKRRK